MDETVGHVARLADVHTDVQYLIQQIANQYLVIICNL